MASAASGGGAASAEESERVVHDAAVAAVHGVVGIVEGEKAQRRTLRRVAKTLGAKKRRAGADPRHPRPTKAATMVIDDDEEEGGGGAAPVPESESSESESESDDEVEWPTPEDLPPFVEPDHGNAVPPSPRAAGHLLGMSTDMAYGTRKMKQSAGATTDEWGERWLSVMVDIQECIADAARLVIKIRQDFVFCGVLDWVYRNYVSKMDVDWDTLDTTIKAVCDGHHNAQSRLADTVRYLHRANTSEAPHSPNGVTIAKEGLADIHRVRAECEVIVYVTEKCRDAVDSIPFPDGGLGKVLGVGRMIATKASSREAVNATPFDVLVKVDLFDLDDVYETIGAMIGEPQYALDHHRLMTTPPTDDLAGVSVRVWQHQEQKLRADLEAYRDELDEAAYKAAAEKRLVDEAAEKAAAEAAQREQATTMAAAIVKELARTT